MSANAGASSSLSSPPDFCLTGTGPTFCPKGALTTPTAKYRAAIIEPKAFGGARAIETYEGAPETRAALELAALTFVRPGELRAAEWREFDLEAAVWSIPGEKMKMKRPHRVPLAPRAVAILRELQTITGKGKFLFPSDRSTAKCMSEDTINAALRRLGFAKDEMTGSASVGRRLRDRDPSLVLLQYPDDLFFRKATALHALVLSLGQSELQTGL